MILREKSASSRCVDMSREKPNNFKISLEPQISLLPKLYHYKLLCSFSKRNLKSLFFLLLSVSHIYWNVTKIYIIFNMQADLKEHFSNLKPALRSIFFIF